ncbi:MAG TPA: DUF86 domain-containing protein [Flavobacteriaceae bacterium]|nr:DUF86 domain-containing protein [Flavobacteriaceae bacterium]
MSKDNIVYIRQILDFIDEIENFTKGITEKEFIENNLYLYAVIRCYETIGEAVKRLDFEFREKHPNISWKFIAGFRDVLIHNYEGVDAAEVWKTTQEKLPKLKFDLFQILENE